MVYKPGRYAMFSLIFLLGLVSLFARTEILAVLCLLSGVAVGVAADWYDNLRDEPFKIYNAKHGHLRGGRRQEPA